MAGSRGFLGSFIHEGYFLKPVSAVVHYTSHHFLPQRLSPSTPTPSRKRRIRPRKVMRRLPAVKTLHEDDLTIKKDVANDPARMFEVTTLVTVRNGRKQSVKEMILNWLDASTHPDGVALDLKEI